MDKITREKLKQHSFAGAIGLLIGTALGLIARAMVGTYVGIYFLKLFGLF